MANGVRTHYVEDGANGPPVVMCHSGTPGSSGLTWFGRLLPELGSSIQAYAPDLVGGYGWTDSSVPASKGALSRLEHLEAFIDTLCLDNIVLIGASQGSWVAAKYAVRHPDRVRHLVLSSSRALCSAMGLDVTDPAPVFDGTFESMRRTLEKAIFDKTDVSDSLVNYCLDIATGPGVREARAINQEGQRRLAREPALRAEFDLTKTLPQLDVPAICYWGRNDVNAAPDLGEALRPLLPNVEFRFLDRAGHQIYRDQATVIAESIRRFR